MEINIFRDRKVSKRFYDIWTKLKEKDGSKFSKEVRKLFDKKVTSKEGEYNSFKIEMSDLEGILSNLDITNKNGRTKTRI